jgi:hypothetical protein
MTNDERNEFLRALPDHVIRDNKKLFLASLLWNLADELPHAGWQRAWQDLIRLRTVTTEEFE